VFAVSAHKPYKGEVL